MTIYNEYLHLDKFRFGQQTTEQYRLVLRRLQGYQPLSNSWMKQNQDTDNNSDCISEHIQYDITPILPPPVQQFIHCLCVSKPSQ